MKIGVFTLQETNFAKKGKLTVDSFEIFEAIRNKEGGGTMVGVHKSLQPILIEEYSDDFELIVVEIKVEGKNICIISGYGPQESWSIDEMMPFFTALEEEVTQAELSERSIMICLDANSKLGPAHIPDDPHDMSENGKVVEGIIKRHALIVGNGIKEKTNGVITRKRTTIHGVEESAIDLVLLSEDLVESLKEINIDEEKEFSLESIVKKKKGIEITKSDHNTIFAASSHLNIKNIKKHNMVYFNLKSKEGLEKFKKATSKDILTNIVEKDEDANKLTNKFMKHLNGLIHECFKKTRIHNDNTNKDITNLSDKRRILRSKLDKESIKEQKYVEEELADKCAKTNYLKM